MLQEFRDFIRYEKQFGYRVLIRDLLGINRLYLQGYYMNNLLDWAKNKGIKFTFFVTARNLSKHRKIIQRIRQDGHEISSHGYHHILLDRLPYKEIKKEFQLAYNEFNRFGIKPKGFRPPFLAINPDVIKVAGEFGFEYISSTVGGKPFRYKNKVWEVPIIDPYDWQGIVVKNIKFEELLPIWRGSKNGTFLFHPWIIRDKTQKIDFLKKRKYRISDNINKISVSFDLF